MKHVFVALVLALVLAGCAATDLQGNRVRSQMSPDRQGIWVSINRPVDSTPADLVAFKSETPVVAPQESPLRRRLSALEQKVDLLTQLSRKPAAGESSDRLTALESKLQSMEQGQSDPQTSSIDKSDQRIAALEQRMQQVEQGRTDSVDVDRVSKRMAAIEAELLKIEKSSELAVQMGLITTVHSDRNEQGISNVRSELDKLAQDIQALQMRLAESDKQLEVGLLQIKDLSTKFK